MQDHNELRQQKRKARAALSEAQLGLAADHLFMNVVAQEVFVKAQRIGAYTAVNGEISLDPVIDFALKQGKEIYLPNLDQQALRFARYFDGQTMRLNKFRIPEPDVDDSEMLSPRELDLVLVPLAVFDAYRNRIGMGGGYYDRSFEFRRLEAQRKPVLMGVAHELQRVEKIEPQSWDVRLDMVISDYAIYL